MLPTGLGLHPSAMPGAHWIPAIFGALVFGYGGWPFLEGAVRELRALLPGMMTLIALAITVAFRFSAAVTLGFPGMLLWEELATLVTIMVLGHWLEMCSITQAQGALNELAKLSRPPWNTTRSIRWLAPSRPPPPSMASSYPRRMSSAGCRGAGWKLSWIRGV